MDTLDLCARLRLTHPDQCHCLGCQAACEIERLQERVASLSHELAHERKRAGTLAGCFLDRSMNECQREAL